MKLPPHSVLPLLLLAVGSGCKAPSYTPPPTERNQLVLRLFQSLERGDALSAIDQGEKLEALDAVQSPLKLIREIQQANSCIIRAQKALDDGDPGESRAILNSGIRQWPFNPNLRQARAVLERAAALEQIAGRLDYDTLTPDSPSLAAGKTAAAEFPEAKALTAAFRRLEQELERREARRRTEAEAKATAESGGK